MLKTRQNGEIWCVTQPDHAAVAGYLAAHWGHREFQRPGYFAPASDPERLRAAVVFGVAQHDNGWWEWEAAPQVSDGDGLPLGLAEVLRNPQDGMDRWRRGIPRFRETHPYGSLLTSFHAYWLYAPKRGDCDPAFLHPLFGREPPPRSEGQELAGAQAFLAEVEALQRDLSERLTADVETQAWVAAEHLQPHARLLQLLDALSLSLCSGLIPPGEGESLGPGRNAFTLFDVPRTSWNDRVEIEIEPLDRKRIVCRPYPFDRDPLPITIPLRVFDAARATACHPVTAWHAQPLRQVQFQYCSAESI